MTPADSDARRLVAIKAFVAATRKRLADADSIEQEAFFEILEQLDLLTFGPMLAPPAGGKR